MTSPTQRLHATITRHVQLYGMDKVQIGAPRTLPAGRLAVPVSGEWMNRPHTVTVFVQVDGGQYLVISVVPPFI